MSRFVFPLAALLLCSTALAGCDTLASVNPFKDSSDQPKRDEQVTAPPPAADIAGSVRQARDLRLAGDNDGASRILSQMMLVASDDPRVVGEYGKTLIARRQPQDAVQFLNRAVQLQSNDWTTYSALGVAYDQLGDQVSARSAYEHALALKPDEASVLSNYALSRLLAGDPDAARRLAARAAGAGGGSDPQIARNLATINSFAPQAPLAQAMRPQTVATAAPDPTVQPVTQPPMSQPATAAPAPQPIPARPLPIAIAGTAPVAAPHPLPMASSDGGGSVQVTPLRFASKSPVELAAKSSAPVKAAAANPSKIEKTASQPAVPVKPVLANQAAPAKVAAAARPVKPVKMAAVIMVAAKGTTKTAVADNTPIPVRAVTTQNNAVPALRLAADASAP